jgi:hypothetical protein
MTDQINNKGMERKYNPGVEPKPSDPNQGSFNKKGGQPPTTNVRKKDKDKEQQAERNSGTR